MDAITVLKDANFNGLLKLEKQIESADAAESMKILEDIQDYIKSNFGEVLSKVERMYTEEAGIVAEYLVYYYEDFLEEYLPRLVKVTTKTTNPLNLLYNLVNSVHNAYVVVDVAISKGIIPEKRIPDFIGFVKNEDFKAKLILKYLKK